MSSFYWVLAFSLAICSCFTPTLCIGESAILNFLEELRVRMCHPIPKFGLPALDPFTIEHREIAVNNKYLIDFTGSVTGFNLTGISDFVINDLKITTVPLRRSTFDITLPLTAFKSLYTAKGSLAYILNLAGDGNAEAYVEGVRVVISWTIRPGVYVSIRSLQITIQVGKLFIDFQNLVEEERINDFFHALVNELGLELLNDAWQAEQAFIEQTVEDKVNNVLGQYTLGEILNIIGGGSGGGGPIFGPDDPPGDCKDV